MRAFIVCAAMGLSSAILAAGGSDSKVEVKGPHICCTQCKNIVAKILKGVDGVSDVSADQATKTVTFTAKNDAAAKAGVKALVDGGFYGKATAGGKEIVIELAKAEGKADSVKVNEVHVCCGACKTAINKLFPDAKVSYSGKGPQLHVQIDGKGLDRGEVLETLKKAGFSGKVEK
jgi:copper chaperone CopZ